MEDAKNVEKWIPELGQVVKYKLDKRLYTINHIRTGMDNSYEDTYFCDIMLIDRKTDKQIIFFRVNYKSLIHVPNPENQFDDKETFESDYSSSND